MKTGTRKPFTLYLRHGIWYSRILNPETGDYLSARCTGTSDKLAATAITMSWQKDGLPPARKPGPRRSIVELAKAQTAANAIHSETFTREDAEKVISALMTAGFITDAIRPSEPSSEPLCAFLRKFWMWDMSPYIKEKLAHGHRIGRAHSSTCYRAIQHWSSYFGEEKRLYEISRTDLRNFANHLSSLKVGGKRSGKGKGRGKGTGIPIRQIARASVNGILGAGTTALRWAYRHDLILTDPSEGLMRFSTTDVKRRGILTEVEAIKVFSSSWDDQRCLLANLVACTCGLRLGEVLALKRSDILTSRLSVEHSWSVVDGLKATKTGNRRQVPLLSQLRDALLALSDSNPHGKDGFVFYSICPKKPMDLKFPLKALRKALIGIGIDKETQLERGLYFHGWRHYWATNMADRTDPRIVQVGLGHATREMTEHYAQHETETQANILFSVAEDAFGKILPFLKNVV